MADPACLACRWAEIQPALFERVAAAELCGHPQAASPAFDDDTGARVPARQFQITEMRRAGWPCGPGAQLQEKKS